MLTLIRERLAVLRGRQRWIGLVVGNDGVLDVDPLLCQDLVQLNHSLLDSKEHFLKFLGRNELELVGILSHLLDSLHLHDRQRRHFQDRLVADLRLQLLRHVGLEFSGGFEAVNDVANDPIFTLEDDYDEIVQFSSPLLFFTFGAFDAYVDKLVNIPRQAQHLLIDVQPDPLQVTKLQYFLLVELLPAVVDPKNLVTGRRREFVDVNSAEAILPLPCVLLRLPEEEASAFQRQVPQQHLIHLGGDHVGESLVIPE